MDQRSVITETTCALEQLTPTILELLDRRSVAFANGTHFDMALRDTFKLQVLDPSSSRGYIRSREIYASEGRQLAAITVYEDGMRNVPRSDPHYALLEQGKANAEQLMNQRVDFMSILPMDIIMAIGRLLITGDNPILYDDGMLEPLPCLQVSKTWRQCLLLCGHLHLKERIGTREFILKDPGISSIISYIKSLTMKSDSSKLCGLLFTTEGEAFESLQKLSIPCTCIQIGS